MILVFGGTHELYDIVRELINRQLDVVVSTATDMPISLPEGVKRVSSRLDAKGMADLARTIGAYVLVDAAHPHAVEARQQIREASLITSLPLFRFIRPHVTVEGSVHYVKNHTLAAEAACKLSDGGCVFLAVGIKSLPIYVPLLKNCGCKIIARVLPESETEAIRLGVDEVITGRGVFSEESTRKQIRLSGANVFVTKDSGVGSGTIEKVSAAFKENCHVIMIERPAEGDGYTTAAELSQAIRNWLEDF